MLGINVMEHEPAQLKEVMRQHGIPGRTFANPEGVISKQWNPPATPAYYLIDHRGIIRHKWTGNPGEQALEHHLDALIREAEAAAQAQHGK